MRISLPCIFIVFILFQCQAPDEKGEGERIPVAPMEETDLNVETFKLKMQEKNTLVLDVRTPAEVKEGKIGKTLHIDFMEPGFPDQVNQLEKDQTVLVYCKVGGRSAKAVEKMQELGFKRVYHLKGGIDEWKSFGEPIENNDPFP